MFGFRGVVFAWQDEGGFGEVGLAGERLHLGAREAVRVGKDGEHVAFEGAFREDIDQGVRELAGG